MRFIRKAGAPAKKSPKRLHVEPAELARKLVKEMDDHVVSRGEQLYARNRYTIYLCTEDYEHLLPRAPQIMADLKAKLAKHVADEDYAVQGELRVEMVLDEELELGYFGILAQKGGVKQTSRNVAPEFEPAESAAAPEGVAAPVAPVPIPAPAAPAPGAAAAAVAGSAAAKAQKPEGPGYTQVLPAAQADELGLEGRVIVITSGDQVMQFRQSRVIIGRSKEADLRVNDPNVSRRHAAIYWNSGRIMIDDLGSTNGTMVNGYPVTRTTLRPTDIVAIGESRLTVEGK